MNNIFIINPHSGSIKNKSYLFSLIEKIFSSSYEIKVTEYAGHASQIAKEAVKEKCQNIIAIGGDGTMNEVASQLVGSASNFGLVPMGSGNGFARSLGLPLKPENALKTIFNRKIKTIDTGTINGLPFFAVAGIGFDAQVASQFQKRKVRGALPYFFIGFSEYMKYSYPAYTVKSPDVNQEVAPLVITIANATEFGNGAKIAPQADIQDGYLDVCMFDKMSVIKGLISLPKMFNGRISEISSYSNYKTKSVEIISDTEEFVFHTDGEPHLAEKKVSVEIIPHSLNVITV
ncbi:MAG: diacylglycerol kinase family lipid kinase [Calditrichaeota bacterium]|nr:MAG: diacylglycerol kinase family lipid kinase [Calditrichota bacterium]MBL1207456.1 diacylglycerol kinase family lipid kinase [Calditrichota bacterium]NOG47288.1 diacylglycerol kinase family lipid kinase [Calditrichota bacterium]